MGLTRDGAVQFRWLGVAGIELRAGDRVLVIDPYFTRFPTWKLWFGRVRPDRLLIAEKIQRCDLVLVTHAHFDHIMDVPDVVRYTGAMVMGSPNSCRLLAACGVPAQKIREIGVGDKLTLKDFQVEVLRTEHPKTPGFSPGRLAPDLTLPLRARDYRMDEDFGFLIEVHGYRVLTDPGTCPGDGVAADALFVYPGMGPEYYGSLLHLVQPKVVVPIHWDDFFRRLTQRLRPYWKLSRQVWPPLQRIDLGEFKGMVEEIAPGTRFFEPETFRTYDLGELL
jgi:L-ascorbate metabolism protein UlaG (beta-lactamase superfamily)